MDNRYENYGLYYLYRHIRLDKNEPFYVGVGKKNGRYGSYEVEYRRAFTKHSRNNAWKSVVAKTDYAVEILFESNNEQFIREKEKEFIKLYGRRDLKTGTLFNRTDGGDGMLNMSESLKKNLGKIHKNRQISQETREKISKTLKQLGNRITDAGKEKLSRILSERQSKPIQQLSLSGELVKEWKSGSEASLALGLHRTAVSKYLKNKSQKGRGFIWKYKK